MLATGANPLSTYRAIFDGSGLNWLFPWVTGSARSFAATNLQQTLLLTTALVLCGLAVSVGFRCGLERGGGRLERIELLVARLHRYQWIPCVICAKASCSGVS